MPNEPTTVETTKASGGDTASDPKQQPSIDTDALREELERTKEALRLANTEAKERRLRLKELEEKERAQQEANLSELERLQRRAEKAEEELSGLKSRYLLERKEHAVTSTAAKLGFRDVALILKLIPDDAVTVDEEGAVDGVDKALKALAKEYPYLLQQTDLPATDAAARTASGQANSALLEDLKRRYNLS